MRTKFKAALCGALAAVTTGGGLLLAAAPAFAATPPAWEPDTNAAPPYGNIVFYDAQGVSITGGSVTAGSPWAYAVATSTADTSATKATLFYATPLSNPTVNPPGAWTNNTEAGPTTFTPAPSTFPATVAADVTNPVVAGSASISSYVSTHPADTTTGYNNILAIRIQDSGAGGAGNLGGGTYWQTDIAYNTTSAAITVDGATVPAMSWVQLFPNFSAPSSTPTLTTSATGGNLNSGSPITLTANSVPTSPAGKVVFEDNGVAIPGGTVTPSGGSATFTYSPANGSHSYTASFVPNFGAETGPNTSAASQVASASSSAAVVTVTVPKTNTSTALTDSSNSINFGGSEALTAQVTATDNGTTNAGEAGNVVFMVGGSPISGEPAGGVATTVSGTAPFTGTAAYTTTSLPTGTDSITAVFTPTNSSTYNGSTGGPVTVTVAAPPACSNAGSVCTDIQNLSVTVNPGTITIATPYNGAATPFVLPAMSLSSDGTYLQSTATFPATSLPNSQQIVVTSQLSPAYAWTLSVSATNLTNGSGGTIQSSGLGLTSGALLNPAPGSGTYPGAVTFNSLAAHNPNAGVDTNSGLISTPQSFAHSTAADGTAEMNGTLTLLAPTSSPSGTYTGTITFTVS